MKPRSILALLFLVITTALFGQELPPTGIRGERVFTLSALKASGGVVLQREAIFLDSRLERIALGDLSLGYDGQTACLYYRSRCYDLPLDSSLVSALANWILRHRTVAFSEQVYTDDSTANHFVRTELIQATDGSVRRQCEYPCFVPREFVRSAAEPLLYTLDFTGRLIEMENDNEPGPIMQRLNGRPGVTKCSLRDAILGSYVNTDVDSPHVVTLTREGLLMSGSLHRYYWLECTNSRLPYIYSVDRLEGITGIDTDHDNAITFARVAALLRAFEYQYRDQLRKLRGTP